MGTKNLSDKCPAKASKSRYISLNKACESSPYSQEYLSLRARQGKLRAIKEGRNWLTTEEWVREYVMSHSWDGKRENFSLNGKQRKRQLRYSTVSATTKFVPALPKFIAGFFVLAVAATLLAVNYGVLDAKYEGLSNNLKTKISAFAPDKEIAKLIDRVVNNVRRKRPNNKAFAVGRVAGARVGSKVSDTLSLWAKTGVNDIKVFIADIGIRNKTNAVSRNLSLWARISVNDIKIFISDAGGLAGEWFINQEVQLVNIPQGESTFEDEIGGREKTLLSGLVVVSAEGKDLDQLKKQIAESFSDEVQVETDNTGTSGIIKPVFREPNEQEYFFMMVPINQDTADEGNIVDVDN